MKKSLLIVESPTKIRTLKKHLGNQCSIAATVGHIRDLPSKELGVDIENGFTPKYSTIPGKQKVITALKKSAKDASTVYLAPDPDREGEAIAWHTAEVLKKKGRTFHRVLFHELTKKAVKEALASPQELDIHKYQAQQARRMLDRLVGYQISPILWRKVMGGLSAGRVQSVAVRIICERERAIQVFLPVEYWTITANLEANDPPPFDARLVKKLVKGKGKKIEIPNEKTALSIHNELKNETFTVEKVVKKAVKRNPLPPFITSKLQQEGIRKLRFSAKKVMVNAQQLYEGIELGPGEPVGLITYMRTDSTRVAEEAALEAKDLIEKRFGKEYALKKQRFFKNKKKVQDAHEAIRPTSVFNTPEKVEPYLSKDQMSVYSLIWKRFVASQMQHAIINRQTISIKAGNYLLTTTGSSVKFPGFMALYMSVDDEISNEKDKEKKIIPNLKEGAVLKQNSVTPKQHFTAPPPRFTEASLVKELEENGIGRPSTYTTILATIRSKGYVELLKGSFIPNELGFIVNDLIVANFPEEFDVEFTAKMEDDLDRIEGAEIDPKSILSRFYESFKKRLDTASKDMLSMKGVGVPTKMSCPECNKDKLHVKVGKNGPFLACNAYPECRYTCNYTRDEKGEIQPEKVEKSEPIPVDKTCDKCGSPMTIRSGRFGKFLACTAYPKCKNTISMDGENKAQETGVSCPEPDCKGKMVQRRSKRGKIFYSCSSYPDCKFAIWQRPVPKECPECGAKFLVEKTTKKDGTFFTCLEKDCGYKETKKEES